MTRVVTRELVHRFRDQHGVISRSQLNALGVSSRALRRRLASGEWEQVGHRAVRLASSRQTPEQDLLAQCLAAGPTAVASHQSAAWLWRLAEVPDRHAVTVPRSLSGRRLTCDVHRPIDFPARIAMVANIPCTDPLRTIVDAAAVMTSEEPRTAGRPRPGQPAGDDGRHRCRAGAGVAKRQTRPRCVAVGGEVAPVDRCRSAERPRSQDPAAATARRHQARWR